MNVYTGRREDGRCFVYAGTKPLDPRNRVRNHSPDGFEWGYGGSGPAQLALAILCQHFGVPLNVKEPGIWASAEPGFHDTPLGKTLYAYQRFKALVVQHLPHDGWVLTGEEVKNALRKIQDERPESPYLVVEDEP